MIKLVTVPKQKRKQDLIAFLLGVSPYGSVLRHDTLDTRSCDGMIWRASHSMDLEGVENATRSMRRSFLLYTIVTAIRFFFCGK